MTTQDVKTPGGIKLGGPMAWYALFLVVMTTAMSMVDRQILAILAPRIKADLNIGDAEMGVLYGAVFGLFYSVFSLPLGRLADGWVPPDWRELLLHSERRSGSRDMQNISSAPSEAAAGHRGCCRMCNSWGGSLHGPRCQAMRESRC